MGTLYVTQADAFIGKVDERLTVKAEQKTISLIIVTNLSKANQTHSR